VQLGNLCVIVTSVSSVATRVVDPLAENGLYLSGRLMDTADDTHGIPGCRGWRINSTCPRKHMTCGT